MAGNTKPIGVSYADPNFDELYIGGVVVINTNGVALLGATAGTVTASLAVVVDANKDASGFRNVAAVNLDAGNTAGTGGAGSVDIFPTGPTKGKTQFTATDNTGNTTTTINTAAMAAASVITVPDLGTAWSVVGTETAQTINGVKTFGSPIVQKGITGITALAGGAQGGAGALTAQWNNVTIVATAADSVTLPTAALGLAITVRNSDATDALACFPATGASINALSANTAVSIPAGASATFRAISSTVWYSDSIVPITGVPAAGGFTTAPNNIHTLGSKPLATADGSDYTVVATEVLAAEIIVPANVTVTGIALFNGSAVAGNVKVGICSSAGAVLGTSASTAQSGTDAYQLIPLTAALVLVGPATYYITAIGDTGGGTSKINCHVIGSGLAAKQTGQVYATGFTTIAALITTQRAAATPFITALGPMASLY